jgi:hypothetical protein
MVIKTELCAFSEWKIYPGRGIRYVAKDGRPFLFLSKRTRDFSLRYLLALCKEAEGPETAVDNCLEASAQEAEAD